MGQFDDLLDSLVKQAPNSTPVDPAAAAAQTGENSTPVSPSDYDALLASRGPASSPPPGSTAPPAAGSDVDESKSPADHVADFINYKRLVGDDQAKLDQARTDAAGKNRELDLYQAASELGAGLARQKSDPTYYNNQREQLAAGVKGAENDVERNRKLVQDYMNNKRAEEVAKDNREARIQAAKDNAALRTQLFQQGQEEKANKRFATFGDALDPDKSRAGNFGQQQQIVYNAMKLEQLSKQFPDGNMPPAQVAELAQATANMLSGGNGAAESTVSRYVPNSVGRDAAGIAQWITNKPHGAEQQGFVKQMLETAARERQLAEGNVKDIKFKRVAQFSDLQKKDPGTFSAILQSHEIDPDEYATYQSNGFKMPKASAPAGGGSNDALEAEMKKRGLLK